MSTSISPNLSGKDWHWSFTFDSKTKKKIMLSKISTMSTKVIWFWRYNIAAQHNIAAFPINVLFYHFSLIILTYPLTFPHFPFTFPSTYPHSITAHSTALSSFPIKKVEIVNLHEQISETAELNLMLIGRDKRLVSLDMLREPPEFQLIWHIILWVVIGQKSRVLVLQLLLKVLQRHYFQSVFCQLTGAI